MAELLVNKPAIALTVGTTQLVSDLTLVLTAGQGADLPATGDFRIRVGNEIQLVTARTTDTLTVTRAQEGTTAAEHTAGAAVIVPLTKGALEAVLASYQAISDAGGEELGYAQVTAGQTGIGTSLTDLTGLSVTVDCDGVRPILIIGYVRLQQKTAAATYTGVYIREGTTTWAESNQSHYAANAFGTHIVKKRYLPTAGSKTFKLAALTANNTCDLVAGPGGPAFIQVIQLGV